MKQILPFLILVLLASCANPPPREYTPWGSGARQEKTAPQPSASVTTKAPKTPAENAVDSSLGAAPGRISGPAGEGTNAAAAAPAVRGFLPRNLTMTNFPSAATAAAETKQPAGGSPLSEESVLPAGTINFPATDLNQVLQIYSELVNRTVLRPATLPTPLITLKTQTPLTKKEAIQAFDAVLEMNGITMINVGDKFVKAVPSAQANQEGAAFSKQEASQLPEMGQYVPT